jgi:hypothetical protein
VQEFTAEGRLGRGYGRFKSGSVAESRRSAVSLDLLLVNLQNLIQRQKHRFHDVRFWNSFSQLLECLSISLMGPFLRSVELLSPRRGLCRRDDQLSTVGTDVERRFGIDLEKVQDRAINH